MYVRSDIKTSQQLWIWLVAGAHAWQEPSCVTGERSMTTVIFSLLGEPDLVHLVNDSIQCSSSSIGCGNLHDSDVWENDSYVQNSRSRRLRIT